MLARIRPGDVVLEPSAGTGMLAVMLACALGERVKDALHLNEIAPVRAGLLAELFPAAATSVQCVPGDAAWTAAFAQSDPPAHCVFTLAIDGRVYARRGTGFDTRLTVLDRIAGSGADIDSGIDREAHAANAAELLDAVIARVPPRLSVEPVPITAGTDAGPGGDLFSRTRDAKPSTPRPKTTRKRDSRPAPAPSKPTHDWGPISELAVETGPIPTPAPLPDPMRRDGQTRCAFRAQPHIRRPWCSPPPWPPCCIPCRPTVRCCPSAS